MERLLGFRQTKKPGTRPGLYNKLYMYAHYTFFLEVYSAEKRLHQVKWLPKHVPSPELLTIGRPDA